MPTIEKAPGDTLAHFGFFVSLFTAIVTVVTFSIALMTPPLTGPFCQGPCFEYPYHEIVSRFPRDYYWMYPTLLLSLLYIMLVATIHQTAAHSKKVFSQIGLSFAIISAAILIPNYFIQISVIQPSMLNNETEGIALITQFNPQGIFIALEEIGFLLMNISFLALVPVVSGKSRVLRALRLVFLLGFILALLSLIFVFVRYGIMREYMFEIMIISIVWLQLIVGSVLLSMAFKKKLITNGGVE